MSALGALIFLVFKMGLLGALRDKKDTDSISKRQGAEGLLVGGKFTSRAFSLACGKGLENSLAMNIKK